MSRRDQIRMTADEVQAFLAAARTLQVATINADGTPHLVAMFYGLLDGEVAFWTYRKSQKVRNLERDDRIACMVETGQAYAELRGVQLNGRATIVDDPATVQRFGELLYERYFGVLDDASRAGVAATGAKRVVIVVHTDTTVSWDHTKLGGTY